MNSTFFHVQEDFFIELGPWKISIFFIFFHKVGERWKDQDSHGQKEKQQAQLFVTVLQGVSYGLRKQKVDWLK